jgi:hypothetical protein
MARTALALARVRLALVLVIAIAASAVSAAAQAEKVVNVVEYYNATLDHYFITADPAEITLLDAGGLGGAWQRTGQSFQAWDANDGPQNSVPTCRFFGTDRYRADGTRIGPNSHFYTADPAECASVRTAFQSLANDGMMYPAWTFETYAFRVILPVNGVCPVGTIALYRAYNNGARGDPNHRYSTNLTLLQSMPGWVVEGIVACLPGIPGGGGPDSGSCMIPVPGHSAVLRDAALDVTQRHSVSGTTTTPIVRVITETMGSMADSERNYSILPGPGTKRIVRFPDYKNTLSAGGATIVLEINDGQQLTLPMLPGETQSGVGAVTGTFTITAPGFSCSNAITGTIGWQWTYVGIETVTVPVGTFDACRFEYVRSEQLQTPCPGGMAVGGATDSVTYWFVPDIGIVKAGGLEMISHSP